MLIWNRMLEIINIKCSWKQHTWNELPKCNYYLDTVNIINTHRHIYMNTFIGQFLLVVTILHRCEANRNEAGECVITAPTQKLRWDGEEYDPCPGTLKYLKVCSFCGKLK